MLKWLLLLVIPFRCVFITEMKGQEAPLQVSYEESLHLLKENNKSIRIARKETEIAKTEHGQMNSFWYPSLSAAGSYMHFSNKIEVKEPLSTVTNPTKDFVHTFLPDDQLISSILDKIGTYSLTFPLMSQDLTSIDANIVWPLFTGGKRVFANKIGKTLVEIAKTNEHQINAIMQIALVDAYFALRLGKKVMEVRKETFEALSMQYKDALQLEQNGMINKAEKLVVQVGMKEALREYEAAEKNYKVAQQAFKNLISLQTTSEIEPVTSLFICDSFPSLLYFKSLLPVNNYLLNQIGMEERIAGYEESIGKTGYLPNIAFIGKQTLFAHGMSKYLVPRTMVGVGFTWNIFDGLDREKKIKGAKVAAQSLAIGKEKALNELLVNVEEAYTNMEIALDNVNALNSTIELSKELLRMRRKEYSEGMATSTQVVDARTMLSKVQIAYLLAYYQFDSALMTLLSLCGIPDEFANYKNMGKTVGFNFENSKNQ